MVGMKRVEGFGICENCKDEYDDPQPSNLYMIKGRLICGCCASEFECDTLCHELAYGNGD